MSKKHNTIKSTVAMEDLERAHLETLDAHYRQGYQDALEHAVITIVKLLDDNDINLAPKEFFKEFKLLKKEGRFNGNSNLS